MSSLTSEFVEYRGSCHCGVVTFKVKAKRDIEVDRCNCSICFKVGYLHLIVPKNNFNLLSGENEITTYTFNTGVAKHTFCSICGVKPFYTPRSNPDGISVNANCLDDRPRSMVIVEFDGQNWEANAHKVKHKSKQ